MYIYASEYLNISFNEYSHLAYSKIQVGTLTEKVETLASTSTSLEKLQAEAETLRNAAEAAKLVEQQLVDTSTELTTLQGNFLQEQRLRKKYYNQIEDMKGKIRVYARCRPLSRSELERGNVSIVNYVDEYTLELETSRGTKPFAYDQVFNPSNTQAEVFEDTKNLLQSAMDGYNVCIFAYGQTGSGTFVI